VPNLRGKLIQRPSSPEFARCRQDFLLLALIFSAFFRSEDTLLRYFPLEVQNFLPGINSGAAAELIDLFFAKDPLSFEQVVRLAEQS
jgi:hypothetical protein